MKAEVVSTLLLAVLLGALVYLGCEQVVLTRQLILQTQRPEVTDMSRSQTWRYLDSENHLQSHTTTTVRGANETKEAFKARFEAEVAADEILYPPVNP